MNTYPGDSFFNGTTDQQVTNEKTYLTGVILLASAAGGDITLRDGRGDQQGRKFSTLQGPDSVSLPIRFERPICFENGIYVDVGSDIIEYTITFIPGVIPLSEQIET